MLRDIFNSLFNVHMPEDVYQERNPDFYFTTRDRKDIVKMSALLSSLFDGDIRRRSVIVVGGIQMKKSLIVDSIVYNLSKDHNPYLEKPMEHSFLETRPEEAYDKKNGVKGRISLEERGKAAVIFCNKKAFSFADLDKYRNRHKNKLVMVSCGAVQHGLYNSEAMNGDIGGFDICIHIDPLGGRYNTLDQGWRIYIGEELKKRSDIRLLRHIEQVCQRRTQNNPLQIRQ